MGGKRNRYMRRRKGMIPKTPQGLELAAKLIKTGVLNDKQVARALQRQGHDFNNVDIQRLRSEMGIKPVGIHHRGRRSKTSALDEHTAIERSKQLRAIKSFKALDLGEKLERLQQAHTVLTNLNEKLSHMEPAEAKKNLELEIKKIQVRITLFSKYVPEHAQRALREQGIIK